MSAPQVDGPLRPNSGHQAQAFASSADILITGGGGGGGKTFFLLAEPLRHITTVKGFGALFLRRELPEIKGVNGPWDQSHQIYGRVPGATSNKADHFWSFEPHGNRIQFGGMQYEDDCYRYKGHEIPLVEFDQVETFTARQFWYLQSRMRSTCGVRPYMRCTCNPVPDNDPVGGWLNRLLAWWWDPESGSAIQERSGVVRWFLRVQNDELSWGESEAEVLEANAEFVQDHVSRLGNDETARQGIRPTSITFIPIPLTENPHLDRADYIARCMNVTEVERERILHGNWLAKETAGLIFKTDRIGVMQADEVAELRKAGQIVSTLRYWDFAGTEGGGCYTAGVKMSLDRKNRVIVEDVRHAQLSFGARDKLVKATAKVDGDTIPVRIEREGGSSGKDIQTYTATQVLMGYDVREHVPKGSKVERCGPLASQVEHGNVFVVRASWNDSYLAELNAFEPKAKYKDQVDASTGAFACLTQRPARMVPVQMG